MSKTKEELGRGIRALLQNIDADSDQDLAKDSKSNLEVGFVDHISLEDIEVNPFQPRADFEVDALQDLMNSVKIHGVIQPISVRKMPGNKFQLIAGERRLRASQMAGLKKIPAYIRAANDQEMLEIALIENIQREDLNAIEIAINYQRLLDECELKHEELAERVSKNRSTVTNYLRLLKLPPEIQVGIKSREISMGHARAIVNIDDPISQLSFYKEIVRDGLSVRKVEELSRHYTGKTPKKAAKKEAAMPFEVRRLQDELASELGTRVKIKYDKSGKGEIVVSYFSEDDLHRIADIIR